MATTCASPEASVIREWLKEDKNCWIAITKAFLQRNEREIAVAKVRGALQHLLRDGLPTAATLGGRLYQAGVGHIDYDRLANELVLATEEATSRV
jgi:hypothetical protein